MNLDALWGALETSSLGSFVAESAWAFPTIESIHVIAIITVVGSIAVMDLRLLRATSRDWQVTQVSRDTLGLTWMAFVVAAITGGLLFVSKANSYTANPYFLIKMVLIALAGINMMIFHSTTWKTVGSWNSGDAVPTAAKVSAGLSLFFWVLVVFFGRAIGFTLGVYA